jgi:hypothetical protein
MRLKFYLIVLLTILFISGSLQAAAPTVELYYYVYDGNDSGERANNALKNAGFEITKGTFEQMDHVGVIGEYKGVITCLNNENNTSWSVASKDARFMFLQKPGEKINLIIFIVAGPSYKEANRLALELKKFFEKRQLK